MKKIALPRIFFVFIILGIVIYAGIHVQHTMTTHAEAAIDRERITYVSVLITASDTLSTIADRHYCKEFGSMEDYVKEIRQYNSLKSDSIYAGNHLIVPIYNAVDANSEIAGTN
ncbi:MAG: LysM peptidoglycan-binding domain-containing protein [Lachnospiraceae bacterium]|nr:LysM peptidoglycan-binding domain-containing protein [Lachnospiraceae bacterium]